MQCFDSVWRLYLINNNSNKFEKHTREQIDSDYLAYRKHLHERFRLF
jgi:hypothetical protein